MSPIEDISGQVQRLLEKHLSIDEFGDWVLGTYGGWFLDEPGNATSTFVGFVIGQFALFDAGEIQAETLRRNLAQAVANPNELSLL